MPGKRVHVSKPFIFHRPSGTGRRVQSGKLTLIKQFILFKNLIAECNKSKLYRPDKSIVGDFLAGLSAMNCGDGGGRDPSARTLLLFNWCPPLRPHPVLHHQFNGKPVKKLRT